MADWKKFRSLSWSDRALLLRAAVAIPIVLVLLRCFRVSRCQAILTPFGRRSPRTGISQEMDKQIAQQIARLTRIAANRNLLTTNCLQRSVVLWWLLRNAGLHSEIRYGSRLDDDGFAAHAWVQWNGSVIGDSDDVAERFKPFGVAGFAGVGSRQ